MDTIELDLHDDYTSPAGGPAVPHLLFTIIDSGVGMEARTLEQLFQPFNQGFTASPRLVRLLLSANYLLMHNAQYIF